MFLVNQLRAYSKKLSNSISLGTKARARKFHSIRLHRMIQNYKSIGKKMIEDDGTKVFVIACMLYLVLLLNNGTLKH